MFVWCFLFFFFKENKLFVHLKNIFLKKYIYLARQRNNKVFPDCVVCIQILKNLFFFLKRQRKNINKKTSCGMSWWCQSVSQVMSTIFFSSTLSTNDNDPCRCLESRQAGKKNEISNVHSAICTLAHTHTTYLEIIEFHVSMSPTYIHYYSMAKWIILWIT